MVAPARPRVLVVVFDPLLPSHDGRRLAEVCGFNDPGTLTAAYVRDLEEASGGYLQYEVVETSRLDGFPGKLDGFRYTEQEYLDCWRAGRGWHEPDGVDYQELFRVTNAVRRVESGEVDEVWLWGAPYFGFWESTMAGPAAYFCNSEPVRGTACSRRFITMGFNYERSVGEMLESFGHRVESLLVHAFGGWREWGGRAMHAWDQFTAYEQVAPDRSGCGTVHFAPNSRRDYDWGNPEPVWSSCDSWPGYPRSPRTWRRVDCREWGGGEVRAHHRWWLAHLPRGEGATGGIRNNWWSYVVDLGA